MPLSARKVETAQPGKYGDGRGLTLFVKPSGARSWVLRYQLAGRRRDLGLGAWPEITLARAREKALEARRLIAEGLDPLAERAKARRLTFAAAAKALIERKRSGWKNAKHAEQWSSTLEVYAFPILEAFDVRRVETAEVLEILRPIWTGKSRRLRAVCARGSRRFPCPIMD